MESYIDAYNENYIIKLCLFERKHELDNNDCEKCFFSRRKMVI